MDTDSKLQSVESKKKCDGSSNIALKKQQTFELNRQEKIL